MSKPRPAPGGRRKLVSALHSAEADAPDSASLASRKRTHFPPDGLGLVRITDSDITGGKPRSPESCPAALALERVSGRPCQVFANAAVIAYERYSHRYATPDGLRSFIRAYDDGLTVAPISVWLDRPHVLDRQTHLRVY